MCQTFYIEEEEVTSVGQLKNYLQLDEFCIAEWVEGKKAMLDCLTENDCLCNIDPVTIAIRLDSKVTFDPRMVEWEYKLID